MAALNIARQQARKQGINITNKKEISGDRVSEDVMTDSVLTELFYFDWGCRKWVMYDFEYFDSYDEARESGKSLTKGN